MGEPCSNNCEDAAQAVTAACAAALMSCTTSSGWDRLIAIGDHVPGRQRFPGRDTHHLLEGARGQRLLHRVDDRLCFVVY